MTATLPSELQKARRSIDKRHPQDAYLDLSDYHDNHQPEPPDCHARERDSQAATTMIRRQFT